MWAIFAAIAAASFACMFLILKKIQHLPASVCMFFVFIITAVFYATHMLSQKQDFRLPISIFFLLVAASLLSYVGNYFQLRAVTESPNPGYATAIVGCQAVILLFASVALFGSELSMIKIVGVALCLAGTVILTVF